MAWIIGGAIIGGAVLGSMSASNASDAQRASSDAAVAENRRQFDVIRSDQAPWQAAGRTALDRLIGFSTPAGAVNPATLDPGYEFRQSEGEKGINRGLAARGMFFSGPAMKSLLRFNQDYATGEYSNVWNRLAQLAGFGQVANQSTAAAGMNTGTNIGNILTAQGNAAGAAALARGNAWGGGMNQVANMWQQNNVLNRLFPQSTTSAQPMNWGSTGDFGLGGYYS